MRDTISRKCQESDIRCRVIEENTLLGPHPQLAAFDEGDGEGAKAVKEGLADEEEAAVLDEGATEFGFEIADTVRDTGFTSAHHVIAGAVGFVRQLDAGIGC